MQSWRSEALTTVVTGALRVALATPLTEPPPGDWREPLPAAAPRAPPAEAPRALPTEAPRPKVRTRPSSTPLLALEDGYVNEPSVIGQDSVVKRLNRWTLPTVSGRAASAATPSPSSPRPSGPQASPPDSEEREEEANRQARRALRKLKKDKKERNEEKRAIKESKERKEEKLRVSLVDAPWRRRPRSRSRR